ncbi:MAG: hypothetical protein K1X36_00350 [Pyrinomonadaceae bacterium]|nr:hypothetical protein [Pyrinomonadaceae bacterium]
MDLRKLFLYILIASVATCALLGIGVLLFGEFGEFESKVLATTFTITCTSILGLACGAYYEAKGARNLPFSGIALSIVAGIMVIGVIWFHERTGDIYAKSTVTATMLAATCGLLSLISLADLDRKFIWSRNLAFAASIVLDGILLWLLWFQPDGDSDIVTRTIGVLSIIIASITVVTPVFHKLSTGETNAAKIDAEIAKLRDRIAVLEAKKIELKSTADSNAD